MFKLFAPEKESIRETASTAIRQMGLVLHRYQHKGTGMIMSAYSNPDVRFWVEITA